MLDIDAPDAIQRLLDHQAITELLTRYCRAIDRCDESMLLSCYHPDAYDDHGVFKGTPDRFVQYLRSGHLNPDVGPIQHSITNVLVDVHADFAFGETYVESRNVSADGSVARGIARYSDVFERRDGEWRILRRLVILEGARAGFDVGRYVRGARSGADPTYWRDLPAMSHGQQVAPL